MAKIPNFEDISWDEEAALEAVIQLRRAADLLEQDAAERASDARKSFGEWRGRFRAEFDIALDASVASARDLANSFRETANRIMRSHLMALEEQRRREEARKRWQDNH